MSKGKIAIGAAVGAIAGIIAGYLTAPKSGKDMRADLRRKSKEVKQSTSRRLRKTEED